MPDDPELSDIERVIVGCFPPRGYGGRADRDLIHRAKDLTEDPKMHISELVELGVMIEAHVPMNCGPGWYYYRLTASGRRLRQAMIPPLVTLVGTATCSGVNKQAD